MIPRRRFLQSAAGVPLLAHGGAAGTESPAGCLARLVFFDDAAWLAAHAPRTPAPLARAIAVRREIFLCAPALQPPGQDALALAAHRAGQAVFESYKPLEPQAPDARLEWDARMMRELAAREGLGDAAPSKQEIVDLFDALGRRVLIAIHTYIPDDGDVEGWMARLIRLHSAMQAYWNELAAAYVRVEARADERYDASDPLILAATAPRRGGLAPRLVERALTARPRCAYARALADAHRRLLAQ